MCHTNSSMENRGAKNNAAYDILAQERLHRGRKLVGSLEIILVNGCFLPFPEKICLQQIEEIRINDLGRGDFKMA